MIAVRSGTFAGTRQRQRQRERAAQPAPEQGVLVAAGSRQRDRWNSAASG